MSIYSIYWYRVAELRPRLRSHVRLYRHIYRGRNWYILQDPSSARQHRFNRNGYAIISLMDGNRTVQEIWDIALLTMGDDAPTQDGVIRLLAQLHNTDVLQSDVLPDSAELLEREVKKTGKWRQRFANPFYLRFPLVDPDKYLSRFSSLAKPFFSRGFFILWILVIFSAFFNAALHWPELTTNLSDRVLRPENLLLLWLVYPFVKLLHEMAHAFATKIWGGEVHEMGIVMLAFTPLPYVEASASAAFPDKSKRIGVAAAGMMIELFLASLALFLWLNIEQGQVSAIAYNVMLIGSLSTVLFNGNPFLRFDGYYVLQDLIEIPNLSKRSKQYLGYLFKRYFLALEEIESPVIDPGERYWFVIYGIISYCYRLFILAVLSIFISSKFPVIGAAIGGWAILGQIVFPAIRNSYTVYTSITGQNRKRRLIYGGVAAIAAIVILFFIVPMPHKTQVQGVVSLPVHSQVRAGTDCIVTEILVPSDNPVEEGDPLLRCKDHFLEAELQVLQASLLEARARYNGEPLRARVQREIIKEEINTVIADLARVQERQRDLTLYSPARGRFILPDTEKLVGRFVRQGSLLGYIMGGTDANVVLVVEQKDISPVRKHTESVELRLASQLHQVIRTTIQREVPAASETLPSPVLGTAGGGKIPVHPSDSRGVKALRKIFQFEVSLPLGSGEIRVGERVYGIFNHGYEPLAFQWYRQLRNLFLRRLHV